MPSTVGSPDPSRRFRTRLAATVLVAAAASGCGTAEPDSGGRAPVRSSSHVVPEGAPGTRPAEPPTVRNLDPDLLAAVRAAADDARDDGVALGITSGWRSRLHQQRLFDEAVHTYGSEEEALRYVSTPDTSAHVTGDAVDIGPTEADDWLREHGADYGLCQVFANEIWHFELATTPGGDCPEMLPDSSYRG
jgi:D-alanyl-D-alanine carboxypeptidase